MTIANVGPLHEYLYVYDKLLRRSEFEEEYSKCRPESLSGLWETHQEGQEPFISWYSQCLARLVQFFCEEFEQLKSLFGPARAPQVLFFGFTYVISMF